MPSASEQQMRNVVGRNLRRLRKIHGLSQEELADRSGVSRPTIAALETGQRASARSATIELLAKAFGEPPGSLLLDYGYQQEKIASLEKFLKSPVGAEVTKEEAQMLQDWDLPGVPSITGWVYLLSALREMVGSAK